MGEIAERLADKVIVTDDNPRTERAEQIRSEIIAKCPSAIEIGDRIEAIEYAISHLEKGDILVLAGKGHETGQKIGDTIIPMNDIDEARRLLKKYSD
jgi:UDP-N-acetylmuramoyl-L-alanyl-D-glutamate--2,6-diaminopimelate ligase